MGAGKSYTERVWGLQKLRDICVGTTVAATSSQLHSSSSNSNSGSAPQVEVAAPRCGVARKQAVDDACGLHHAIVLAQVVLGLGQEGVQPAIAANQRHLPGG